jgi:hypothetical protein
MNRISRRISDALTGIRCPGCRKFVQPTLIPVQGEAPDAEQTGPRWSFVWRPPSGEVCPECQFPLARYARRVKWIRTFQLGVVLLTISVLLYLVGRFGESPTWVVWTYRVCGSLGGLAFLVGLVGLVVGGKHGPEPVSSSTGTDSG